MRDPGDHFKHQARNCLNTTFPKVSQELIRKGNDPDCLLLSGTHFNIGENSVWDCFVGFPSSSQFLGSEIFQCSIFTVTALTPEDTEHNSLRSGEPKTVWKSESHSFLFVETCIKPEIAFFSPPPPRILCQQHVKSSIMLPKWVSSTTKSGSTIHSNHSFRAIRVLIHEPKQQRK